MKSYSTYIFDWDGCLAKTLDIWLEGYKKCLTQRNIHLKDKQITKHFGDWHGPSKLGVKDEDEFFDQVDRFAKSQLINVDVYPTAHQTLQFLKKNHKQLCLVSSSLHEYIQPALKKHKLFALFDFILSGEDVTHHKPDPEGINLILNTLNVDPKTTIMVGDSDKDIKAANNAGIDSGLFFPDHHTTFYTLKNLQKSNPTYIITSLSELII